MPTPKPNALAAALLDRHGRTYAQELSIPLEKGTPSPLFRLVSFALLAGARIGADLAVQGTQALADAGYTTARHMADASWDDRVKVLNEHGYARYDEKTSRFLQDTADHLLDQYQGDLRKLRERADRDPGEERRLIKQCKGIGDTGVDIFFREVQLIWDELYPFADKKALAAAQKLGLGDDAQALQRLTPHRPHYVRLLAALIRCDLAHDQAATRAGAD